jgi:hypothetical protein
MDALWTSRLTYSVLECFIVARRVTGIPITEPRHLDVAVPEKD